MLSASQAVPDHGSVPRRKEDDNVIDDDTRSAIRGFCQGLVAALNKYYAFGSAFVDEAT